MPKPSEQARRERRRAERRLDSYGWPTKRERIPAVFLLLDGVVIMVAIFVLAFLLGYRLS